MEGGIKKYEDKVEQYAKKHQKLIASAMAGLLFLVIASPFAYQLVSGIVQCLTGMSTASKGCPTLAGLILHAVVFAILARVLMM